MRVSRLITTNTKRFNLDQQLSGRDLFVGPNGCGKSARLESFLIGLLGYVPGKGRELSDTFKKSSGEEMSITLELDTGFKSTRTIKEKRTKHQGGEKSFSLTMASSVFPPRGEKTESDRRDRISTELGDFSIMFDLAALFSMSDNERRKFIFALTDPVQFGWTKEKFLQEILGSNQKFAPYTKELGLIWRDDTSVQDNVTNCLLWVKNQISEKKAALKKALAAKEQLLQQKREIGSDPGSSAELGAEYQKAKEEFNSITAQIAAAQEKIKMSRILKYEISCIQTQLAKPETPLISETEIAGHINTEAILSAEIEKAKAEEEALAKRQNELREELAVHSGEFYRTEEKVKAIKTIVDKILGSKGICPLIGKKCKADLQSYAVELGAQRDEAQRELNSVSGKRTKIQKDIENIYNAIRMINKSRGEKVEILSKEVQAVSAMRVQNATAIKDQENRQDLQRRLEQNTKSLSDLQLSDVGPLEAAARGLSIRMQELEKAIDKRKTVSNLMQSFDRANIEATELEEIVDILDDLARFLGPANLQGRILKDTIGPLISKVNSLLDMTGRAYNLRPVMQDKNEKEIFGFAWQKDGVDIDFESLSGGERVVFSAALACALVLQKNPPLKALVIEAAEADAGNLTALMEAINKFGGDIGNVLIATHTLAPQVEGWQLHNLG